MADMDELTALVQRLKDDVEKPLANVFKEIQKKYEAIGENSKLKIQEDIVDGWNKMETNFQVV